MLLVLGRPGSGCSTMLKTLAAYTESYRAVEGTISYDGMSPEELRKHHKAEAAYLPEDDKVSIARSSDRRKRRRNAPRLRYRISLRSRT
jgi:ABC-type multidrug transport system ATPase subunit